MLHMKQLSKVYRTEMVETYALREFDLDKYVVQPRRTGIHHVVLLCGFRWARMSVHFPLRIVAKEIR